LYSGRLQTAASYLIILQNLEKPSVSRQHATLLLVAALDKSQWDVARDLIRFLRAIDPSEVDSLPPGGVLTRMSSNPMYSSSYHNTPAAPEKPAYPHVQRSASFSSSELSAPESNRLNDHTKVTTNTTATNSNNQDTSSQSTGKRNSRCKEEIVDQFCIDNILDQHARKLLASHRLRDLGMFAANMEDFKVIGWLRRERLHAAKVDDFVMAVREVHLQFHWPLPIPPSFNYQHLKKSLIAEDSSVATTEVLSDNSSWLAEQDISADPISLSTDIISQQLEMLTQQVANKGPLVSDLELRYLLQLILEAGCLEWALIISVVLRDTLSVVRTVNTASMTDTPLEMLGRMREGLSFLELWAETECIGYKTFFLTIREQIQVLDRIANQMPAITKLSVAAVEEVTPVTPESKTVSPAVQTIRKDSVETNKTIIEPQIEKHTKTNDCLLS
ncbi:hypothetical protein Ahia01_001337400, partial [Argonauta hians]